MSGRAAAAAFYPAKLVAEILRGIRDTADAEALSKEEQVEHDDHLQRLSLRAGARQDVGLDPIVSSIQQS